MTAKASVTVHLVLEVEIDPVWGPNCTIGQVRAQGIESAERTFRLALEGGKPERERLRVVRSTCANVTIMEGS